MVTNKITRFYAVYDNEEKAIFTDCKEYESGGYMYAEPLNLHYTDGKHDTPVPPLRLLSKEEAQTITERCNRYIEEKLKYDYLGEHRYSLIELGRTCRQWKITR